MSEGPFAERSANRSDAVPEGQREARLVRAACLGDVSAIEALYRTHYDAIYRYVLYRLGSSFVAEDLTSQVFTAMCRRLSHYRQNEKPFIAWLYGIAQRQVTFYQRSQNRKPSLVDLEAAEKLIADTAGPEATAAQREQRRALARALHLLPESQREVILLRYVMAFSLAETAAATERSVGAVKQMQLRGLVSLQAIVQKEGIGPA